MDADNTEHDTVQTNLFADVIQWIVRTDKRMCMSAADRYTKKFACQNVACAVKT